MVHTYALAAIILVVVGCDAGLTRLRGSGLLQRGSVSPFQTDMQQRSRVPSIGVKSSANVNRTNLFLNPKREGKNFLSPIVRKLGSLQFKSKNTSCESKGGRGRCLYVWECSNSKGTSESSQDCQDFFFHQCCIDTEKVTTTTTITPTEPSPTESNISTEKQESDDSTKKPESGEESASSLVKPDVMKPPSLSGFTAKPKAEIITTTKSPSSHYYDSFLNPLVYDCGFRPLGQESRILGGKKAGFGSWPWIVSVRKLSVRDREGRMHRSGGSLISDQWILTAAHTVARTARIVVDGKKLLVRLGDYNLKNTDEKNAHIDRTVSKIIVHPEFNGITYENDIALLKLDKKVEFQDHIQPVCLPEPEKKHENIATESLNGGQKRGTVAGWGRVAQGGDLSDTLLDVELPIISNTECERMFANMNYTESIPEQFICAGGEQQGGRDSCQGDSGGPMVEPMGPNRWQLVGIVSWGIGCGVAGLPGVLTSVPHYTDWVISNIHRNT